MAPSRLFPLDGPHARVRLANALLPSFMSWQRRIHWLALAAVAVLLVLAACTDKGRQVSAFLEGVVPGQAGNKGHADYTRMGSNGHRLSVQEGDWSDNGDEADGTRWDCVRDNVTGLWWEVKRNTPHHLRHKDYTYTWYNPDATLNGGNVGFRGDARTCAGTLSACNTLNYVAAVNAAGLCGKRDWRLPTVDELQTLVHVTPSHTVDLHSLAQTGRADPTVDTEHLPNSEGDWYWPATSYAFDNSHAWCLYFGTGYRGWCFKGNAYRVRLVRSGP